MILADGTMRYNIPMTYTLTKRYDINELPENTYQIEVKPGQLKKQLLDLDPDEVNGLVLTGTMNGEDLKFLADAQGLVGSLAYLDLEKVKFEYDETVYRTYSPSKGFHEEQKYIIIYSARRIAQSKYLQDLVTSDTIATVITWHGHSSRMRILWS